MTGVAREGGCAVTEPHAADTGVEQVANDAERQWPVGVNADAPPYAREAAAAYRTELDELLAHLAAHPEQRWVAYRYGQRIGFGTDDLALQRECEEKFPDGLFRVYGIDGADKYPEDTVV
jgi:hypothetical protein